MAGEHRNIAHLFLNNFRNRGKSKHGQMWYGYRERDSWVKSPKQTNVSMIYRSPPILTQLVTECYRKVSVTDKISETDLVLKINDPLYRFVSYSLCEGFLSQVKSSKF
jgi:hypothetical protein